MERKEISPEIGEQGGEREADLSPEEKRSVEDHIVSLITKELIYGELTIEGKLNPSRNEEFPLIYAKFEEYLDLAVDLIIGALRKNTGVERLKELIEENNLAGLNLFIKTEIGRIAKEYYEYVLDEIKKTKGLNKRQEKDLEQLKLGLGKYPIHVIEAASEVLSRTIEQEELGRIKTAVENKLREIEEKLGSLEKESLQKKGINVAEIEAEMERIRQKEKEKIVKNCLERFKTDGYLDADKTNQKYFDFWINYYTDGAFEHSENKSLREAFQTVFELNAVRPLALKKEPNQEITVDNILVSDELREFDKKIKNFFVDLFRKRRENSGQRGNLSQEEKKVIEEIIENQYEKRFIPAGSPRDRKFIRFYMENIINFLEEEISEETK